MIFILFILILLILFILFCNLFGFLTTVLLFTLFWFFSFVFSLFIIKKNNKFVQYFGSPGTGKTTIASSLVDDHEFKESDICDYFNSKCNSIVEFCNKKGRKAYSNVTLLGAEKIDVSKLGVDFFPEHCVLIIDESGLEYNNRDYKNNFTKENLTYYKEHRHYDCDIFLFSQSFDDSDKKLRDLTTELYLVKRSFFPFCIRSKRISKKLGIDKVTRQPIDKYSFVPLSGSLYFMPKYWKKFDSFVKDKFRSKNNKIPGKDENTDYISII